MNLQTRRPPGHGKRKALTYAADIISLRGQGHSLSAIREALEDAGVLVSISTVRREVLRGASAAVVLESAPAPSSIGLTHRGEAGRPLSAADPALGRPSLPGKTVAEEFMRGRPTNPLFLKESST